MNILDPRLVQVGIEVNGLLRTYNTLRINAHGIKFANANQNEAEVQIANLDRATQDYILTETSPFNTNITPKTIILYAGRQSYGLSEVYRGTIVSVKVSQPPDVTITLRALTGDYAKGSVIARFSQQFSPLSQIAKQIAGDLGLSLNFQAEDKTISNYSYSGSALKQIDILNQLSNINAFQDDETLVVTQYNQALPNITKVISIDTGMIGIPDITERGIRIKFLFDNTVKVGGLLRVSSLIYPVVNGDYLIYKLNFEISNRDTPFYYIAEAKRI